jgi:hypothetical protein
MKKPSLEFLMLTLVATAFFVGSIFDNKISNNKPNKSQPQNQTKKYDPSKNIAGHAYKINDQLHLAVLPLEESETHVDKAYLKKKFPEPKRLDFLLGGIYFYTPGKNKLQESDPLPYLEYDENIVKIVSIQPVSPEDQATLPQAGKDARVFWRNHIAINKTENPEHFWGMECYTRSDSKRAGSVKECLAERSVGEWAIFTIHSNGENSLPHPTISTRYFTPKFGGLKIHWLSNSKNTAQWKEIDEKMWKLIDAWNIAN